MEVLSPKLKFVTRSQKKQARRRLRTAFAVVGVVSTAAFVGWGFMVNALRAPGTAEHQVEALKTLDGYFHDRCNKPNGNTLNEVMNNETVLIVNGDVVGFVDCSNTGALYRQAAKELSRSNKVPLIQAETVGSYGLTGPLGSAFASQSIQPVYPPSGANLWEQNRAFLSQNTLKR